VDAEPGEADVVAARGGGDRLRRRAELEQVGSVADRRRLAVGDLEQVDAVERQEATMEELHLERQLLLPPQRAVGAEADCAVLVVIHFRQRVRQLAVRRLIRFRGQVARGLAHDVRIERLRPGRPCIGRRRWRGSGGGPDASGDRREGDDASQQMSAIQDFTPGTDRDRRDWLLQ